MSSIRLLRRRLEALVVVSALLATTLLVADSDAELEDNVFRSDTWRVEMEAPTNWQPTEQTAYPNILLWMERRDPRGVLLLAAERIEGDLDTVAYAKKTAAKLDEMGFTTRPPQLHTTTGASLIDFESEKAFLRQAYLVKGGIGYTLTLSATSSRLRGFHLRAFDSALRSIKPMRESAPATPASNEAKKKEDE